jgi:hypothetical protein
MLPDKWRVHLISIVSSLRRRCLSFPGPSTIDARATTSSRHSDHSISPPADLIWRRKPNRQQIFLSGDHCNRAPELFGVSQHPPSLYMRMRSSWRDPLGCSRHGSRNVYPVPPRRSGLGLITIGGNGFERPILELRYRDAIRDQALGLAYATDDLEVPARYEVHLDSKLGRTLAMLTK